MIYNLYSSLPLPMQKRIRPDSDLAIKLTTIVFSKQKDFEYVHLYEDKGKYFQYVKTVRLLNRPTLSI